MIQTRWADCHRGWAHPIALAGAERCKAHVAEEGGSFYTWDHPSLAGLLPPWMGTERTGFKFGWQHASMGGHLPL